MSKTKFHWRQICKEYIRSHTEIDAIRFWYGSYPEIQSIHHIFNYKFEHTLAVVKTIKWLSPLVGADLDITECSAWLHDCRKFINNTNYNDNHAYNAANAVELILQNTDFPKHKIAAVQHAILFHAGFQLFERLKPIETACLWDSDKLSKIGAIGLTQYQYFGKLAKQIDTQNIIKHNKQWLKNSEIITKSMNTNIAKKEARKRLIFLNHYYKQLVQEWYRY